MAEQRAPQLHPFTLVLHHRLGWPGFPRARQQDAGIVSLPRGFSWAGHQDLCSAWAIQQQARELFDRLTATGAVLVLQTGNP